VGKKRKKTKENDLGRAEKRMGMRDFDLTKTRKAKDNLNTGKTVEQKKRRGIDPKEVRTKQR